MILNLILESKGMGASPGMPDGPPGMPLAAPGMPDPMAGNFFHFAWVFSQLVNQQHRMFLHENFDVRIENLVSN